MILQYNPFRVGPTDLSKVLIYAFIHLGPRDLSKVLIYAFIHLHTFQIRSSQSSFSMGFFTSQHFGFPFLKCKKPFTLHDFPTNLRNLGFQAHVMPQSSEGSRETSTWTVGDQLQWGPKPNKSRGVLPGLETSGITIMDFLKDLGVSWVAHTSQHETACQVEDVSILLPGNANQ